MTIKIITGDCREMLKTLADGSIDCVVTSPPYFGLRDYGVDGQMGLEAAPDEFIAGMVAVFRDVRRVLRDDGTLWLNIGDSYANDSKWGGSTGGKHVSALHGNTGIGRRKLQTGLKSKDLIGIPWLLAFALRADGWYLRQEIIWAKPNGMPGSQIDRCTSSHESIFLLSKSRTYYSDFDAIKTPPRESTLIRTSQDLQAQAGSHRTNGGTRADRPFKAQGGYAEKPDKQRGHSRRHEGFNDRWDKMSKDEQQAAPAMMRDVWFVPTEANKEAHFAMMPREIARRCIMAGCKEGGTVLDPFGGAGTTALVADQFQRNAVIIELNPDNVKIAHDRIFGAAPLLANVEHA